MVRLFVAIAALGWCWMSTSSFAAPAVEAYAKLPAVEQISLAPSGQRYAFISVIDNERRLVAVAADGKTPLYATDIGANKVTNLRWAGEDHLLLTIEHTTPLSQDFAVSKWRFPSVIAISLTTKKAFVVFDHRRELGEMIWGSHGVAQIGQHWYGYYSGVTYYGVGDTLHPSVGPDLYRVDLDTGEVVRAAQGSNRDTDDWLVSADGRILAHSTYKNESGAWQVMSGEAGGRLLAAGVSPTRGVEFIGPDRAGDGVLVRAFTDGELSFRDLKFSADNAARPPEADSFDAVLVDQSGRWVGNVSRDDAATPVFFEPVAQARALAAIKAFPGVSVALVSYTTDLGRMIVRTTGAGDSGTLWLVDIATGAADPIGYEYPAVKPADVGSIAMVTWKAADGLELHGALDLPVGRPPKNLPVIVMPHTDLDERAYPVFSWWSQLFVSRGYAVFRPNVRGSSGYGKAFQSAKFGEWGRKTLTDQSDGLAFLARQGIVDPHRACIVGWGDGGYTAQSGVTLQQGVYRCAVSIGGLSDPGALLNYFHKVQGGRDAAWQRELRARLGARSESDSALSAVSPLAHAGEANAPLLLVHGGDDILVPAEQSRVMEKALKSRGKPVEYLPLPNADHNFSVEDMRLAMAQASLNFVLKNNPPDLEPAPVPRLGR